MFLIPVVLLFAAGIFLLRNKPANILTPEPVSVESPTAIPATPVDIPEGGGNTIPANEEIIAEMKKAFSLKYNKPKDTYILNIDQKDSSHAKGMVNFKNELGGGLWFAAKTDKGWELVFDGNGIMGCDIANKYSIPREMLRGCVDTHNGNAFIER